MTTISSEDVDVALRDLLPGVMLTADDKLSEHGIDSMSIISMILALEQRFAVSIPEDLLSADAFSTPRQIALTLAAATQRASA